MVRFIAFGLAAFGRPCRGGPAARRSAVHIKLLELLPLLVESRDVRWLTDPDDATRRRATQLLLGPDTLRRQKMTPENITGMPAAIINGRVHVADSV